MEDFQAVVLATGDESALYPLVEEGATPHCLLPVAGSPLVSFPLLMLEKTGFKDVILVCRRCDSDAFSNYVCKNYQGSLRVDLQIVDDDASESIQALRQLKGILDHDILVIPGDLVNSNLFMGLLNSHRISSSSVSMMLQRFEPSRLLENYDPSRPEKGRAILRKLNRGLMQYFGIAGSENKVVYMKNGASEDPVSIPKNLLAHHAVMTLQTDLIDLHAYVLRNWVVQLLIDPAANCKEPLVVTAIEDMTNLATDFVPFIVNKMQPRHGPELDEMKLTHFDKSSALTASSGMKTDLGTDRIECHCHIGEPGSLGCRVTSLFAYSWLNHHIVSQRYTSAPWNNIVLYNGGKNTVVGRDTEVGSKVQLKNCVIGSHCVIGAGSQLSNTIVMDHCVIGNNVVAQNSTVSHGAEIPSGCHLDHAQLQAGTIVVPAGVSLRDQAYLRSDFS